MKIPYQHANTGMKARAEVNALLERFGCESVGWMDEFANQSVLLAFRWRGHDIQMRANAGGWAAMYLKEHPWTERRALGHAEYEAQVLRQGMIATNSILRDWVKGQITAIECGLIRFEHVFLAHILTHDGRTVGEVACESRNRSVTSAKGIESAKNSSAHRNAHENVINPSAPSFGRRQRTATLTTTGWDGRCVVALRSGERRNIMVSRLTIIHRGLGARIQ